MPEVIYYAACSVDGYIATPSGGIEWLGPFEESDQDFGNSDFYASIDSVVLGSRTYEQALTFDEWPYEGKPTWVVSKRPLEPQRDDVTVTDGDPEAVMAEIASRGLERTYLVGGGALAGSFQVAGLISAYVISIIPVFLGAGVPLFGDAGVQQSLHLVGTTEYPNGVLQLRYSPA